MDYLTKEVRKNNGEVPSVRVRNSHEAIIEPEVFDKVQKLLAEYSKRRAKVRTKHPFAGKIICGDCGEFYGHKVWRLRSTGEHYNVWYCNHKYDGNKTCDSSRLRETEVKEAFEKMLQNCGAFLSQKIIRVSFEISGAQKLSVSKLVQSVPLAE